jgi:hypothetical protein
MCGLGMFDTQLPWRCMQVICPAFGPNIDRCTIPVCIATQEQMLCSFWQDVTRQGLLSMHERFVAIALKAVCSRINLLSGAVLPLVFFPVLTLLAHRMHKDTKHGHKTSVMPATKKIVQPQRP